MTNFNNNSKIESVSKSGRTPNVSALTQRLDWTRKLSALINAYRSLASSISLKGVVITGVLLGMVLMSAIGVVYSSHLSRQLFSEQALLLEKNDQLQLEWAQLLLEQSAWSSPSRIESVASEKLAMVMPDAEQIKLIY